jgi:threonine synthase
MALGRATAHAAKFPDVIRQALSVDGKLPEQAVHKSIEAVKHLCQHVRLCDCTKLAPALTRAMQSVTKYRKGEMVCKKEADL